MLEMRRGPRLQAGAPKSKACNQRQYSQCPGKSKTRYCRVSAFLDRRPVATPPRLIALWRGRPLRPGEMPFTLERSARGFVVQFGDGGRIEIAECVLRSEQRFRHRVRVRLGRDFLPRSLGSWLFEVVRAADVAGLSLDFSEEVRRCNEAAFEAAFESYCRWGSQVGSNFPQKRLSS
jgi:hypothetical protein